MFLIVFRFMTIPLKSQLQAVSYQGLARVLQKGKIDISENMAGFVSIPTVAIETVRSFRAHNFRQKDTKSPVYVLFSAVYYKWESG